MNLRSATPVMVSRPHVRSGRGEALASIVHVLLLLLVLTEVVYLASRYRVRVDSTADSLYSLTDSTRKIVGGLEKRLVVEAYFSKKDELPVVYQNIPLRDTRTVLDNFLDELVQLGKGKVVVQRFNPIDDKVIEDKCTRIGVKPIDARSSSTNALAVQRHWQGLRLLYGGGKQKVIDQLAPTSSFVAEAQLTLAIKEVVTETRRKMGYMEWPADPAPGGQQQQGNGWNVVRSMDEAARRYDFQNVKDTEGALIPIDLETLLLFRPKDLSDRQKYVIDQFLMRGGTVVVFADVAEYAIGPRRTLNKVGSFLPDEKDSKVKWKDQLASYGIDIPGQIVADMAPDAFRGRAGYEYLGVPTAFGPQPLQHGYPYFFNAVMADWTQLADRLATVNNKKDEALAAHYKKTWQWGVKETEPLFKPLANYKGSPGFYWPCVVDVVRQNGAPALPPGCEGGVVLWSSPLALTEDPPMSLNALAGNDQRAMGLAYNKFIENLQKRQQSEARRQVPLMVDVHGPFASFFAGKDRPKKASEIKEEEARKAAEDAKKKAEEEAHKAGQDGEPKNEAGDQPGENEGAKQPDKLAGEQGPPAPKRDADKQNPDEAPKTPEPEPIAKASKPGRIVVFGDSDFLRDDLVRGDYQQMGGPVSPFGRAFFLLFVDWLSQDDDLVALQSRSPALRTIELVEQELGTTVDPRDAEKALRGKTNSLIAVNVVVPCGLLLALGLVVFVVRRTQKSAFLASVGG